VHHEIRASRSIWWRNTGIDIPWVLHIYGLVPVDIDVIDGDSGDKFVRNYGAIKMGFAKILTLYMCISISLYIGTAAMGAPLEFSDTVAGVLGVSGTGENTTVGISEDLNRTINQTQLAAGRISTVKEWVGGGLSTVWGWILFLFNIVFLPVQICVAIQAPWPITMVIAILPLLFIAHIMAFIRGAQI